MTVQKVNEKGLWYMKMLFRGFFLLAMLGCIVTGVQAGQISQMQKKELVQLDNDMNEAARRRDTGVIVNNMPERLYREIAIRMHVTELDLRENLKEAVRVQFDELVDDSYMLDVAGIWYAETGNDVFLCAFSNPR